MNWTDEKLKSLTEQRGFRLRGEAMTRIEVFSDAAFAFAITMLVISLSAIPENYGQLIGAFKGIPTFVLSFSTIMGYWLAHRRWSQRFGLDDTVSTFLTLGIVVVILVFVYPLKLIMSYFCNFASGGWLPTEFSISSASEMTGLVLAFGVGSLLLAFAFLGLYLRVYAYSEKLRMNPLERLLVREQIAIWCIVSGMTLLSVVVTWLLNPKIGYRGGYIIWLVPILILVVRMRFRKLERRLG